MSTATIPRRDTKAVLRWRKKSRLRMPGHQRTWHPDSGIDLIEPDSMALALRQLPNDYDPDDYPVSRDEHGRILPGSQLNPLGRPLKDREITNAFRQHLNRLASEVPWAESYADKLGLDETATLMEVFAAMQIRHACSGNASFAKQINDRVEGKVPEKILSATLHADVDLRALSDEELLSLRDQLS